MSSRGRGQRGGGRGGGRGGSGGYDWMQHVRPSEDPEVIKRVEDTIQNFLNSPFSDVEIEVWNGPERNTYRHYAEKHSCSWNKTERKGIFLLERWYETTEEQESQKSMTKEEKFVKIDEALDNLFSTAKTTMRMSGALRWAFVRKHFAAECLVLQRLVGANKPYDGLEALGFQSIRYQYNKKVVSCAGLSLDAVSVDIQHEEITKALEVFQSTLAEAREEAARQQNSLNGREENFQSLPFTFSQPPPCDSAFLRAQIGSQGYQQYLPRRQHLPVFTMREEVCRVVSQSQVTLLLGATGCGKTTQVPQFLLEDSIHRGEACRVIVTQPRRISAVAVAERVAMERGVKIGDQVGYQVRFDAKAKRDTTQLFYCTVGILLRHLRSDPSLGAATHIIVDEVHERDVNTDFLLLILSRLIKSRPNLKLILMSATVDPSKFLNYFPNTATIEVPGKTNFPIEELFLEDVLQRVHGDNNTHHPHAAGGRSRDGGQMSDKAAGSVLSYLNQQAPTIQQMEKDGHSPLLAGQLAQHHAEPLETINFDLIASIVESIHKGEATTDGAILVFLTGWFEIAELVKRLEVSQAGMRKELVIFPVHGMMPTAEQKQIFDLPPRGKRKVVVATNIAETSITIEDVVHVIDCGRIKQTQYHPTTSVASLVTVPVSKANAQQRRGRAGRVRAGTVFRLYSRYEWDAFSGSQVPEMQRTPVEELALQVKTLKLGRIDAVLGETMDPPSSEAVGGSICLLTRIGALQSSEADDEELTELGKKLADMPIHPILGKLILFGAMFGCLSPILTIAAGLGYKSPFYLPLGKEAQANAAKLRLANGLSSDHMLLVRVYEEWAACPGMREKAQFCNANFLSMTILQYIQQMRSDMERVVSEYKIDQYGVSTNEKQRRPSSATMTMSQQQHVDGVIEAVLCGGLKVCRVEGKRKFYPQQMQVHDPTQGALHKKEDAAALHPGCLAARHDHLERHHWLVYFLLQRTTKLFLYDCTLVSSLAMLLFTSQVRPSAEFNTVIELGSGSGSKFSMQVGTRRIRSLVLQLHSLVKDEFLPEVIGKPINEKHRACLTTLIQLLNDPDSLMAESVNQGDDEEDEVEHQDEWVQKETPPPATAGGNVRETPRTNHHNQTGRGGRGSRGRGGQPHKGAHQHRHVDPSTYDQRRQRSDFNDQDHSRGRRDRDREEGGEGQWGSRAPRRGRPW